MAEIDKSIDRVPHVFGGYDTRVVMLVPHRSSPMPGDLVNLIMLKDCNVLNPILSDKKRAVVLLTHHRLELWSKAPGVLRSDTTD